VENFSKDIDNEFPMNWRCSFWMASSEEGFSPATAKRAMFRTFLRYKHTIIGQFFFCTVLWLIPMETVKLPLENKAASTSQCYRFTVWIPMQSTNRDSISPRQVAFYVTNRQFRSQVNILCHRLLSNGRNRHHMPQIGIFPHRFGFCVRRMSM
jgi:hypothetical protein